MEDGTMLVLSRKQDEKIIIGDSITLMVISIQGDKVRLGIEAPKHVSIHREEVYQAIQRERGSSDQLPRNEAEQPRSA
jgi:carbon storage regulator